MGPDTSQTIQNGGGQISNRRLFVSISCFFAQLGKVPTWDHQIWNLLKKAHPVIPISSILGHILYASKSPPPYPIGHITTLQPLAIAIDIAMQSVATVRVHYNEGTWTGAV